MMYLHSCYFTGKRFFIAAILQYHKQKKKEKKLNKTIFTFLANGNPNAEAYIKKGYLTCTVT